MKNPAVDACIAKSAQFGLPIHERVRALMHEACPQIEETIKWGVAHFEYEGIVGNMAAFRQHAAFGFWSRKLLRAELGKEAAKMFPPPGQSSMGGRKPPPGAPPCLVAALKKNTKSRASFGRFTPARVHDRMARRGQAAQLQVPELLSP